MRKLIFVFLIIAAFSCRTNQGFLDENANTMISQHIRVAVLPFKVIFSEDFKQVSPGRRQDDWQEQARVAGLDLQKAAFAHLSKRTLRKNWGFTVQDFLTTNRTLEVEGIRFSELQASDKAKIARVLGVDAVIWGESQMEYSMRNFVGRNGMRTQMNLYDARSSNLIWSNSVFQDISRMMDSPRDLANNSVSSLVNMLPYKSQGKRVDY